MIEKIKEHPKMTPFERRLVRTVNIMIDDLAELKKLIPSELNKDKH